MAVPAPDGVDITRWRTAIHEAGHVLADHQFEFGPHFVDLETARGGSTVSCVVMPAQEELKNFAISLYCGAEAERATGYDDGETKKGERSDLLAVEEIVAAFPVEGRPDADQCRKEARLFVEERLASICRLALDIAQRQVTQGHALMKLLEANWSLPEGTGFGIVEASEPIVVGAGRPAIPSSALVLVHGEPAASTKVTPIGAANANRLRRLIGLQTLLIVEFEGCTDSYSIRAVRESEGEFILDGFDDEAQDEWF